MPWTKEEAREAASKGGKARAAKFARQRKMTPEERALEVIHAKVPNLVDELLDAALGVKDFDDLDLKTRVQALTRALEWGLGKPTKQEKKPEEGKPVGFNIE